VIRSNFEIIVNVTSNTYNHRKPLAKQPGRCEIYASQH